MRINDIHPCRHDKATYVEVWFLDMCGGLVVVILEALIARSPVA